VALEPSFTTQQQQLSQTQRDDPVLSVVINSDTVDFTNDRQWSKFPLHCYQQLWRQLSLQGGVLCRGVKSPTVAEETLLIAVPSSLCPQFLQVVHDKAGH